MNTKLHYLKLTAIIPVTILFVATVDLQAQDYLISFAGTGASTTVDSVKIENLTRGTKLKMNGNDVLRLTVVTGLETIDNSETSNIMIYPNPMKDNAKMQFILPVSGETLITIYDISGRIITQTRDFLSIGKHTYGIQGIKEGIYFMRVSTGKYSCAGRLMSSGSQKTDAKIVHENIIALQEKQSDSKGVNEEKVMQYTTGDRLLLKGFSTIHSTVVTDVPIGSKTVTFNFIPCTDGDGNNYSIVQIGSAKGTPDNPDLAGDKGIQTWMAENLRTTKYRNGDPIPTTVPADLNISGDNTSKYQWPYIGGWWGEVLSNANVYGRLYTWNVITDSRQVCPLGWHVPTDNEWHQLVLFLDPNAAALYDDLTIESFIAGGKLKETGTAHWASPHKDATNETGFTALGGGGRTNTGTFQLITVTGNWWSSTEHGGLYAFYRLMGNNAGVVNRGWYYKACGFSVRCLKD